MNLKYVLITLLSLSLLLSMVHADTNGVWHLASDIRGGVFGSDEQPYTSGFSFINPVTVNENLIVSGKLGVGTITPIHKIHLSDPIEGVMRIETNDRTWCEGACASGIVGTHSGGFIEWYDRNKRGGWIGFGNGYDGNLAIVNELPGKSILFGSNFNFATGGGYDMIIASNGNVGIGTSNPLSPIHIKNDVFAGVFMENGISGNIYSLYSHSNGNLVVGNENIHQPLLTVTSLGNVGIGTPSPSSKLHVNGNIIANGEIISTSGNSFRDVTGNYGFIIRNDGASTYMLLTNPGDQYGSWNTLRPFSILNSNGNVQLGGNALTVQHAGNVGIGTAAPAAKLHVAGNIIASEPTASNHVATKGYVDSATSGGSSMSIIAAQDGYEGWTGTAACADIGKVCEKVISYNYIREDSNCPGATHCLRICSTSYNQALSGVVQGSFLDNIHSCDALLGEHTTYLHINVVRCNAFFTAYCK